ncbi:MAG: hypothetical protein V1897_13295, partial [Pseudomonadota bacterium]
MSIYIQSNIGNFLRRLSQADKAISSICEQEFSEKVYNVLLKGSEMGEPIDSNSQKGATLLENFAILSGDPTVTADVFFLNARSDQGFLQWAIGPFEIERFFGAGVKAIGMEMVFFEGWNDAVQ